MTEAERALLDYVLTTQVRETNIPAWDEKHCKLAGLKNTVAMDRLEKEVPGWRAQFIELAVTHFRLERKFGLFESKLQRAGIETRGKSELFREAWALAFPEEAE